MSAMYLLDPWIIHHVNPAMLVALSTGVASAAMVAAAAVMGRWFTRMERAARAEGTAPSPGPRIEPALPDPTPAPSAFGALSLGPATTILPLAPMSQLSPLAGSGTQPTAAAGSAV